MGLVKHALNVLEKVSNIDFDERFGPSMYFLVLNDTPPLRIYKNDMAMKKSSSWVVIENTLDQSDWIIFQILLSQKLFEVESLRFACSKISIEAVIRLRSFSWVWSDTSGMPIVL